MSPRRRDILKYSGVALTAALAGCTESSTGDENNSSNGEGAGAPNGSANNSSGTGRNQGVDEFETTELGEDVSMNGTSVAVSDPTVRSSLFYEMGENQYGLAHSTGTHYLVVSVASGEGGPAPEKFKFVTQSNGNYGTADPTKPSATAEGGHPLKELGEAYDPENGVSNGWLAFTIPGGIPFSSGAIAVDGTTTGWKLGEDVVSDLATTVPAFSLDGVDAPESVQADSKFEVTASFTNTSSSTNGTVRGLVDQTKPTESMKPFSVDIEAGKSADATLELFAPADAEEVVFTIRTDGGKQEVTVAVESGEGNSTNTSDDATNSSGN